LFSNLNWVEGRPQFAVRHRGSVFLLSSEAAAKEFMANPDQYCPVLSGFDPWIYLTEGRLVPGSVQHGLTEGTPVRILLFSSEGNKSRFASQYASHYAALERIVQMAQQGGVQRSAPISSASLPPSATVR
jgi:YHS domain-containing protein